MKPPARKKTCLHLVAHSSPRAMENCLAQFDEDDAVLFLDDGVMHLVNDRSASVRPLCAGWFFSEFDLEARGLLGLAQVSGAVTLTDSGIAGLLQTHDFCLTWK